MKKLTSAEVRRMFLEFFQEKGHMVEPSASLIPVDDPSLLWINSGVATLKKYFDGRIIPENPRICNAQKSIRTNDIENVGKTARHHTFFEMLGNFSIGDYFKREAIHWAWEFLTSDNGSVLIRNGCPSRSIRKTRKRTTFGATKSACQKSGSFALKATSGTSAKARAARIRKFL